MFMKRRQKIILPACGILAAGILLLLLWLNGNFLPRWAHWEEKTVRAHFLDGAADRPADGRTEISAQIHLRNRRARILKDSELLYASQLTWRVFDAFAADLDEDGSDEIILLVWKHGSYGTSAPFWEKRDDLSFSQHVFIYHFRNGAVTPYWMSSAVGMQITGASMDAERRLHLTNTSGMETVWAWEGWGLKFVEEYPVSTSAAGEADPGSASGEAAEFSGAPAQLSFLAGGDNLAHGSVCRQASDAGTFDFSFIYREVKDEISSYDLAAVNQETILVDDPSKVSDFPLFGTPVSMGDALADAGFDIVLGATNHANDKGQTGLADTLSFWKENHPEVTLLGLHAAEDDHAEVHFIEKNGIRLALFDYTEHLNGRALPEDSGFRVDTLTRAGEVPLGAAQQAEAPLDDAQNNLDLVYINLEWFLQDLISAEESADLSICFLHIGDEYSTEPAARQRALCEKLIGAGADVIICSHSHVLQPFEMVRTADGTEGVVYWSLGNFMSHQTEPGTAEGGAADLLITKSSDSDGTMSESNSLVFSDSSDEITLHACSADGTPIQVRCRLRHTVCTFDAEDTVVRFTD